MNTQQDCKKRLPSLGNSCAWGGLPRRKGERTGVKTSIYVDQFARVWRRSKWERINLFTIKLHKMGPDVGKSRTSVGSSTSHSDRNERERGGYPPQGLLGGGGGGGGKMKKKGLGLEKAVLTARVGGERGRK